MGKNLAWFPEPTARRERIRTVAACLTVLLQLAILVVTLVKK